PPPVICHLPTILSPISSFFSFGTGAAVEAEHPRAISRVARTRVIGRASGGWSPDLDQFQRLSAGVGEGHLPTFVLAARRCFDADGHPDAPGVASEKPQAGVCVRSEGVEVGIVTSQELVFPTRRPRPLRLGCRFRESGGVEKNAPIVAECEVRVAEFLDV